MIRCMKSLRNVDKLDLNLLPTKIFKFQKQLVVVLLYVFERMMGFPMFIEKIKLFDFNYNLNLGTYYRI